MWHRREHISLSGYFICWLPIQNPLYLIHIVIDSRLDTYFIIQSTELFINLKIEGEIIVLGFAKKLHNRNITRARIIRTIESAFLPIATLYLYVSLLAFMLVISKNLTSSGLFFMLFTCSSTAFLCGIYIIDFYYPGKIKKFRMRLLHGLPKIFTFVRFNRDAIWESKEKDKIDAQVGVIVLIWEVTLCY